MKMKMDQYQLGTSLFLRNSLHCLVLKCILRLAFFLELLHVCLFLLGRKNKIN